MSLVLWAALLLAQDSDAEREADMFGETSTAAPPAARVPQVKTASQALDLSEHPELPEDGAMARLSDAVGAANDYLDIGGDLWLFAQASFLRDGELQDTTLASPSFLDVYLDARPIDRVRAYGSARMSYDFTVGSNDTDLFGRPRAESSVALDQLWLKFDLWRTVFVTAGKQRIRWGSSRIWNPTDFLNQSVRDPFNFLDLRLGVALLKLHVPIEAYGWNFYAIANAEDASSFKELGGALRAELAYESAELSLTAAAKKNAPIQLGADLSVGVWLVDFRAELAVTKRNPEPYYSGELAITPRGGVSTGSVAYDFRTPTTESRRDEWIPQLVLGADISIPIFDNDTLIVGAEYFYNGKGYVDGNLLPWLIANGQFNPLYMSRHYLGFSAVAIAPGDFNDTTIVAFAATSLSDGSWFGRVQYAVKALTYLDVGLFGTYSFGDAGALNVVVDLPVPTGLEGFLPDAVEPFVENGRIAFSAPALTLGATLSLRL